MNEETIIMNESTPANDPQERNEKKSSAWKYVTLGGVSGILIGAGAMYAGTVYAKEPEEPEEVNTEESPTEHSEVNRKRRRGKRRGEKRIQRGRKEHPAHRHNRTAD